MSLRLDMWVSPIKFVRIRKGPVLTQKYVDYNVILIRFNGEIGLHPISISNMTKIPLESSLFWVKTGPFLIRTNLIGDAHISMLYAEIKPDLH